MDAIPAGPLPGLPVQDIPRSHKSRRVQTKMTSRVAPRVISLLCTLRHHTSGAALPPGLSPPGSGTRGRFTLHAEPLQTGRLSPALWPLAPLAVPKTRQVCALKISTARKEASHRANRCPEKENGIPVRAAVSCPSHQHPSARAVRASERAACPAAHFSGRPLAPATPGHPALPNSILSSFGADKQCPPLSQLAQTLLIFLVSLLCCPLHCV